MKFMHPELILSWPSPNYINPETRGPILYYVNGCFFVVATVAVFLRLYIRMFVRKWVGIDDMLILAAWVSCLVDTSCVFWGYKHFYWDRHLWDSRPQILEPGTKLFIVTKAFWTTCSTFVRLSVVCLFYRLLNHIGLPNYRWVLHLTTFTIIGIWLSNLGTTILVCIPLWSYWVFPSPGYCINEGIATTVLAALNTCSESLVAALPLAILSHLEMSPSQRRNVACLLCLGFFVSVVGAIRTYFVWMTFSTDDLTWYAGPHWICSEVEITVALICACAPVLSPFFSRKFGRKQALEMPPEKSFNMGSFNKTTSTTSMTVLDKSNYTSYATYWKTVDVEGIALDGLGYTVTITAGTPKSGRKSWFRSLIRSKDEETAAPAHPELRTDTTIQTYRSRSKLGWGGSKSKEPIEIVTRNSFEVVEENYRGDATSPHRVSSLGSAGEIVDLNWALRNTRGHQSFFYDVESDAEGR